MISSVHGNDSVVVVVGPKSVPDHQIRGYEDRLGWGWGQRWQKCIAQEDENTALMKSSLSSLAMKMVHANPSWYLLTELRPNLRILLSVILQAAISKASRYLKPSAVTSLRIPSMNTILPLFKGSIDIKCLNLYFNCWMSCILLRSISHSDSKGFDLGYCKPWLFIYYTQETELLRDYWILQICAHIFTNGEVRYTYIFIPTVAFSQNRKNELLTFPLEYLHEMFSL